MPATIRSAAPDDLPAILSLEKQSATAAHWPAEEYEKLLKSGIVLVCEQQDEVCGFVCARVVANECELENIVVAAEFQRQGIGGRLLEALIERVLKPETSGILLEVRESNRSARRLYEKHGFREVGRRPRYYNNPAEDALLYQYR